MRPDPTTYTTKVSSRYSHSSSPPRIQVGHHVRVVGGSLRQGLGAVGSLADHHHPGPLEGRADA
jgi:hypothetical protein